MGKVGILYKTDEHVDYNRTNIREQIEDILDDPNNLQFKEYQSEEEMFKIIHDSLGSPDVGVTACNIYETKDVLYAGYFIDYTEFINHDRTEEEQKEHAKNVQLHIFGSQLTSHHVTSNLVIVKKKLEYVVDGNNVKTKTVPDTVTRYELTDILEKIYVKDGVVVDTDGQLSQYQYIVNPLEHLMMTDNDYEEHYVYHEYEVYNHVMMVIVDVRENNGTLNKTATLLCNKPVMGKVFVALYRKPEFNENPPYASLSIDRFNSILNIRKRSAELTTGMDNSSKEYVNFEKILQLENEKHSNIKVLQTDQIKGECLNCSS